MWMREKLRRTLYICMYLFVFASSYVTVCVVTGQEECTWVEGGAQEPVSIFCSLIWRCVCCIFWLHNELSQNRNRNMIIIFDPYSNPFSNLFHPLLKLVREGVTELLAFYRTGNKRRWRSSRRGRKRRLWWTTMTTTLTIIVNTRPLLTFTIS